MSLLQKEQFTLHTLRTIKKVIEELKASESDYEHLVDTSYGGEALFNATFKQSEYGFYFKVVQPKPELDNNGSDNNKTLKISYKPQSSATLNGCVANIQYTDILKQYKMWIGKLEGYNELDFDIYTNDFLKTYEKEIFLELDILDADANTHPFEDEKQLLLLDYMTYVEDELTKEDQNDENIAELANEATVLRDTIQGNTKRQYIRKLSAFYAKTKKTRLALYKKLKDKLLDAIIKGAIDEIPNIAHRLNEFIHHDPHKLIS